MDVSLNTLLRRLRTLKFITVNFGKEELGVLHTFYFLQPTATIKSYRIAAKAISPVSKLLAQHDSLLVGSMMGMYCGYVLEVYYERPKASLSMSAKRKIHLKMDHSRMDLWKLVRLKTTEYVNAAPNTVTLETDPTLWKEILRINRSSSSARY